MNLYTQMIGGIGDILLAMMKPGSPLGYFPALKARGDTTMIVAHANTDETEALFKGLPHVDHLRFRGKSLKIDTAPGEHFALLKNYDGLEWEPPQLVLDETEQRILGVLTEQPYVAVHVAASLPEKIPPAPERLLLGLRDANIRTVLLGIESTDNLPAVAGNRQQGFRAETVKEGRRRHILIPPLLRLHVAAAMHATKFIGTLSCFNCAVQLAAVPSFVLVNRSLQEPNIYRMMHTNGAIIAPYNAGAKVTDQIYLDAVEWAKQ